MKPIIADGDNYFSKDALPITIRFIADAAGEQHRLDFTEIKHQHQFSEIVIITKGIGTQWVEGYDFTVGSGDVFYLQGDQEHYFKQRKGLELYNIMFDPDRIGLPIERLRCLPGYQAFFVLEPNYRQRHNFKSRLHLKPTELEPVLSKIRKLENEIIKEKDGFDVQALSVLIDIIVHLCRQYANTNSSEGKSLLRLGQVIGKLEDDYNLAWTLPEIAKIAGMSSSNLLIAFRDATGFTPIDYLIRLRIRHAMRLLRSTSLSISEIAYQVGFEDSNYFSRQFRNITGVAPREYRKSAF